ncbi:uncharacterized protein C12orf45 homolog [Sarcophilus harrisii]|uniref:uncharacterized protein C12orf45 homolog n=1 Tax=Sarcophilus harrisii TaxID=9305 RepID=UPI00062BACE0|nr:uncharacterized protein C12orf45 homolog [Sarcophilus harrisii]
MTIHLRLPPPGGAGGQRPREGRKGAGVPAHAHVRPRDVFSQVSGLRGLRSRRVAGMAELGDPENGRRGRAARSGDPDGVRTSVSHDLLRAGCASAGGIQDMLLIGSKGKSPGLKTVRIERSSVLERVKNFLPHIEQANKKLKEEMASGPPDLFNIENVDDSLEKIIEMDVAVVEVSSSDSEGLSSEESSESEDESSLTREVTVENMRLPKPRGRKGKIEVLDS